MSTQFLNQKQLAKRWAMSHRTLELWRRKGRGPAYAKLGGKVIYRLDDIEVFEQQHMHTPTPPNTSGPNSSAEAAALKGRSFAGDAQEPSLQVPKYTDKELSS